jgi:hypothetical protein
MTAAGMAMDSGRLATTLSLNLSRGTMGGTHQAMHDRPLAATLSNLSSARRAHGMSAVGFHRSSEERGMGGRRQPRGDGADEQ